VIELDAAVIVTAGAGGGAGVPPPPQALSRLKLEARNRKSEDLFIVFCPDGSAWTLGSLRVRAS
jgi:hypothetical protein